MSNDASMASYDAIPKWISNTRITYSNNVEMSNEHWRHIWQMTRSYLTQPNLLPNPCLNIPWQRLLASCSDHGSIVMMTSGDQHFLAGLATAIIITTEADHNAAIFFLNTVDHCTECIAHGLSIFAITVRYNQLNQIWLFAQLVSTHLYVCFQN